MCLDKSYVLESIEYEEGNSTYIFFKEAAVHKSYISFLKQIINLPKSEIRGMAIYNVDGKPFMVLNNTMNTLLNLIDKGVRTSRELGKYTNIPDSTIYVHLIKLANMGLISVSHSEDSDLTYYSMNCRKLLMRDKSVLSLYDRSEIICRMWGDYNSILRGIIELLYEDLTCFGFEYDRLFRHIGRHIFKSEDSGHSGFDEELNKLTDHFVDMGVKIEHISDIPYTLVMDFSTFPKY